MVNNQDITVTGPSFEDMSIAEMTQVQGSGDVAPETTPACVIILSKAITGMGASFAFSVAVVKTLKGNC